MESNRSPRYRWINGVSCLGYQPTLIKAWQDPACDFGDVSGIVNSAMVRASLRDPHHLKGGGESKRSDPSLLGEHRLQIHVLFERLGYTHMMTLAVGRELLKVIVTPRA